MMKEDTKKKNIKICIDCNIPHTHASNYYCKKCYYKRSVKKLKDSVKKILCACGCGEEIPGVRADGKLQKFKRGHNSFGNTNTRKRGWYIDREGYKRVYLPYHRNYRRKGKYVLEHHIVIWEYLGRQLNKGEVVNHINGNKLDNRIENLKLLSSQAEHIRIHIKKDMSKRVCSLCKSITTYVNRKGYADWYKCEGGYRCKSCHRKVKAIEDQIKKLF